MAGPSWYPSHSPNPLPSSGSALGQAEALWGIPGDKGSQDVIQLANQHCPGLGLKLPTSCPQLLLQLGINVHQALTPGARTVVRGHRIQAACSCSNPLPLNPERKWGSGVEGRDAQWVWLQGTGLKGRGDLP